MACAMGGYADVDHLSSGDMDTAISIVDGVVGVAFSQASLNERKVAAKSASMRGNDCDARIGSWCC